ncbi:MAG: serine/threonine-protein phosphatase [Rhodocyclaceae bacterium]|nr:serine/threonine-protein phosphatase [Rhodocyclaceae bacterium]
MKFSIFQESRIGGRARNEDRLGYRYTREALLMVLADGLGGHGHGEVAAEAAVRSIVATFEQQARPRLSDPQAFLADALAGAHVAVLAQSGLRQLRDPPRTTCVACVVQDGCAAWAHAGDSRLYLLRNGRILARTEDHSRVQPLVAQGRLAAAEARHHPWRHQLTSCLGGDGSPRFEFSAKVPLKRGDVVLLCSDGVWGPLADETPLERLSLTNPIKAAPRLLDRVESLAGSGRDNLSLLVLSWQGEGCAASPAPPGLNPPQTAASATRKE